MASTDLCTLAEVRAQLVAIRSGYTDLDALIAVLITAASETIMDEYEREFAPASTVATRTFPVYPAARDRAGNVIVDLAPYDVQTVTAVLLHPEASSPTTLTAGTDYKLAPVPARDSVYTRLLISGRVTVSSDHLTAFGFAQVSLAGTWGFASVPNNVKQATVDTVRAWLERTPPGALDVSAGITPEMLRTYSIPSWARMKLQPFARHSQVF